MKAIFNKVVDPNINLVHNQTGEIIDVLHTTVVDTIDEFGFLYVNNLELMYKLSRLQTNILFYCWKHMSFSQGDDGNKIYNTKTFKQGIINDGITLNPSSIDVAIHSLVKKGLLIRLGRGEYLMNPKVFFKGRLADKAKLEHRIVFNPDNSASGLK